MLGGKELTNDNHKIAVALLKERNKWWLRHIVCISYTLFYPTLLHQWLMLNSRGGLQTFERFHGGM